MLLTFNSSSINFQFLFNQFSIPLQSIFNSSSNTFRNIFTKLCMRNNNCNINFNYPQLQQLNHCRCLTRYYYTRLNHGRLTLEIPNGSPISFERSSLVAHPFFGDLVQLKAAYWHIALHKHQERLDRRAFSLNQRLPFS